MKLCSTSWFATFPWLTLIFSESTNLFPFLCLRKFKNFPRTICRTCNYLHEEYTTANAEYIENPKYFPDSIQFNFVRLMHSTCISMA